MARHREGPVEDWDTLLAERLQEEDPKNPEKKHEIALLELFREKFQLPCPQIYYPGCGTDRALRRVFPESHITYVDSDPDEIKLRELMDAEENASLECAYCDECVFANEMDVVYGKYAQFNMSEPIETLKVGGYYLCDQNDNAGMFDAALHNGDFKLITVLRALTVLERIGSIREFIRSLIDTNLKFRYMAQDEDLAEYVTTCRTDEELRQHRPDIYWRQRQDIPYPAKPDDILRSTESYTAINSPKHRTAKNALYVFQRKNKSPREI